MLIRKTVSDICLFSASGTYAWHEVEAAEDYVWASVC